MIAQQFLTSIQRSCDGWKALASSQKNAYAVSFLSRLFPGAVIRASQITALVTATDGYCDLVRSGGIAIRPAGQAASPSMSSASSYFNGPTLLASALAFGLGYAACHYLAPPEPARPLPRRR